MTREQAVKIIVFLKEAASQIDNARVIAVHAADAQTLITVEAILRATASEIDRLDIMKSRLPSSRP